MNLTLTREQKLAQRQLRAYLLISDRMGSAVDMLARADAARQSISASIGEFSMGGGRNDKMLQAMVNMDEAVDRIKVLSERFADEMEAVEGLVSDVQAADPKAGCMLRTVYLGGMSPSEAAESIGCSKGTAYALLKRGLDLAYGIMGEDGVITWK